MITRLGLGPRRHTPPFVFLAPDSISLILRIAPPYDLCQTTATHRSLCLENQPTVYCHLGSDSSVSSVGKALFVNLNERRWCKMQVAWFPKVRYPENFLNLYPYLFLSEVLRQK